MSRRSKRTSLDAILVEEPVQIETGENGERAGGRPERGQGTRPAKRPIKQQTVYLPLPVYEQLRRLAFEERRKMHDLLMEGLDRVFKDRGLASLDELRG